MSPNKKWDILYIEHESSKLDSSTKAFQELFNSVDKAIGEQKALKLISSRKYDIVINDMSVEPLIGTTFMKQVKQFKPDQAIVALVMDYDEQNIGGLIDLGINSFLLTPEQFEQALEAITEMEPYKIVTN